MIVKKFCILFSFLLITVLLIGCENKTENGDIGYIQEDVNTEVPEELVGTWEVTDGLPTGLTLYELTIEPNGQVTQTSQLEKGESTTVISTISVNDDNITLLDPSNTVLMTLYESNGQLMTDDLGDSTTVLTKKN